MWHVPIARSSRSVILGVGKVIEDITNLVAKGVTIKG